MSTKQATESYKGDVRAISTNTAYSTLEWHREPMRAYQAPMRHSRGAKRTYGVEQATKSPFGRNPKRGILSWGANLLLQDDTETSIEQVKASI